MSVGGKVIEAIDTGEKVWINTCETRRNGGYGDYCAIYVRRDECSLKVQFGDTVWWQSGKAYWTSAREGVTDFPLVRIGYSHDPRTHRPTETPP